MNVKRTALLLLFLFAPGFAHAKLFLLLDERLKKSRIEQVIYKFVPLTNASEVELNYVQGFLKDQSATAFAAKLKSDDRGIYIGADAWPDDPYITELTNSRAWFDTLGKISFFIESNAPDYARMPKGLYPRRELWKKYAELTGAKYAGFFPTHYLDTTPIELKGDWPSFTCVHETGRELKPGKGSPLSIQKNKFQMSFRQGKQLDFTGNLACVNTPKGDAFFEVQTVKTDVALEADSGRFSLWNEAQSLKIRVASTRQITAPLALEIVPEVNETQVEFFFQGERITCTSKRCRRKGARFLLPQFRDFNENFEFAIRAPGETYFRGKLRLMAGEIEIARTEVRFTPQSWVAETSYALRNPSEYQSLFLIILALITAVVGLSVLLWRALENLAAKIAERSAREIPRQTSATLPIERGVTYHMTAGENPFGCELYAFGGIVVLRVDDDRVAIKHAGEEKILRLDGCSYRLPDGYVLEVKVMPQGGLLLEVFLVSLAARAI